MIRLILGRSVEEYKKNFFVSLSFAVLFLFAIVFALPFFSTQFFVSSGTEFLSFSYSLAAIVGVIIAVIFLYIFSFFISLVIYSIHRDVQSFSIDTYWSTLLKSRSSKIFILYLGLAIIFYLVSFAGLAFGFSALSMLICFLISLLVMYAPQSIVLDEVPVAESIKQSISFWVKNFSTSVLIVVLSSIILFILVCIEWLFGLAGWSQAGSIVSLVLVLLFLVPFVEQIKSYAFVLKYALIRHPEIQQSKARHQHIKEHKTGTVRLREKAKGGKL